jgi:dihydroflavonol-4-reductase
MKVLVTGATGFVGNHVARQLVDAGNSVRVLVRKSSNPILLEDLRAERSEGDLRDILSLARALKGVHRVFHVAADYRLWSRNPDEIYQSNVAGTRALFEAARQEGVQKIVYTSTVATIVTPSVNGALPNEDTHATLDQMVGHYKRSKFMAELDAIKAAADGLPVVIVNPTTPVGPGDGKPTPTGRIIVDFLNGKMPAYVDTGLNIAAVEDIAAGHLLAAEKGRVGERYLLGARNMTLKEILDALAAITGLPAPRVRLPHAVAIAAAHASEFFARITGGEPQIPLEGAKMSRYRMFVSSDKASRELGYTPGPVEPAFERAVGWYRDHGYIHGRGRTAKAAARAA